MSGLRRHCVLFDLDGTLVDTAPDLTGALNRLRAERDLAPFPEQQLRSMASQGAAGLLRVGLGMTSDHPEFERTRARYLEVYAEHLAERSALFKGLAGLLDDLSQQGRLWGIVTNKPGWLTQPLLEALGLASRAACVVSGDCTPTPKPEPAPVLLACQRAAVSPEQCVLIGDDRRDVEAGQAANTATIAVGWGYHPEDDPPTAWGADAYAASTAELRDLLG